MKNKNIIRIASAFALLVAVAGQSQAAPLGTAFTYQGRLNDGAGAASGHYDLKFALFDVAEFGFPAGPLLTNANVTVQNGLFVVTLDFGAAFNGDARWLEISVRTNGAATFLPLAPRQPLTPVPYAVQAAVLTGTLPDSQLSANIPRLNAVASFSSALTASAFNGNGAGLTNLNPTNLLGTVPDARLSANIARLNANQKFTGLNTITNLLIADGTGANVSGGSMRVGLNAANGDAKLIYFGDSAYTSIGENGADDRMELRAGQFVFLTGDLGLGGPPQDARLDIEGNARLNDFDLFLRAGSDRNHGLGWFGAGKTFAGFNLDGPVLYGCAGGGLGTACPSNQVMLTWNNLGNVAIDPGNKNNGNVVPGLTFGANSGEGIASKRTAGGNQFGIDFYTGSNARMRIFNGGAVSIGGTNADQLLDVNGNAAVRGSLLVNSRSTQHPTYPELPGILFGDMNSGEVITSQRGTNGSNLNGLDFYTGFGKRVSIANNGNVGIGRQPTANRLEVAGNASKDVAGSWLANSDSRIKQEVQPVTGALEKLDQVRLVSFRYTDDYRREHPSVEPRRYVNVVAQEFREVFPDDVKRSGERLPDGSEVLQVDTYPLTIYSAAAVQELNQKFTEELKRRDAENAKLQARLERLEELIHAKNGGGQ